MFKRYFILTALLVLIPVWGLPQSSNWNSIIDLNVTVDENDHIDLYADKDGLHIILQESGSLKYTH